MSRDKRRAKILIVVGTRPEVIKMAPVYLELIKEPRFEVKLCATGQHSDLLTLALQDFDLTPDYKLELMEHGQGLGSLTSRAISSLEGILQEAKPDAVLVHGDTTTTFSAALAAFYAQIPVGHVEAGLRTRDIYSPFPEEFNRQAVSRIARWNFAPTAQTKQNLINEGVDKNHVTVTGNTIVDAIGLLSEQFKNGLLESSKEGINNLLGFDPEIKKTVLVTTHRRENLGEGISSIFTAVQNLSESFPDVAFVLPLHPNPSVRSAAIHLELIENVILINPLSYPKFLLLLNASHLVITDSGGIQEEAVTLGKKVIVARGDTERKEGLDAAEIILTPPNEDELTRVGYRELLKPMETSGFKIRSVTFGNGVAAYEIRKSLLEYFFKDSP